MLIRSYALARFALDRHLGLSFIALFGNRGQRGYGLVPRVARAATFRDFSSIVPLDASTVARFARESGHSLKLGRMKFVTLFLATYRAWLTPSLTFCAT